METDLIGRARRMVELLERRDARAATEMLSTRIRSYIDEGWSLEAFIRDVWHAGLDELAGERRRIIDAVATSSTSVRFTFEGDRGAAIAAISFDEDGGVGGIGVSREVFEGIGAIVIGCPNDKREKLAAFYDAILGADRWRIPQLGFGEGRDYQPPRWGDPQRPQQLHLDFFTPDLVAAEELVLSAGATVLQQADTFRTYADPVGHAFCMYARPSHDSASVLGRIVIDCPDPRALAPFYEALLRMPKRVEDSDDRVVIARADGRSPMLGFQRVTPYVAPRWADPKSPAQMHFDMRFDDAEAAADLVTRLGGTLLPPQGGSCPVYADPVGHPFCLCKPGQ